jgi:plasmid replication initiation protein
MSQDPLRPKLKLKPRDAFAQMSLHEKNAYLQQLANEYAAMTNREAVTLDRDALSRLRRYYSRRVFADLKLEEAPSNPLNDALRRLGNAIRDSDLQIDVSGALEDALPRRRIMRTPPADDAQMMFFVPAIYDAPIKDDVNLMDVAPFSISRHARPGVIKYELKDCLITIEGGAEVGIATVFDYDIFLAMVSHLAEDVRRFLNEESKGLRPTPVSRTYRPNATHILKFCRRSDGGKAYEDLENALSRLKATSVKVTNLARGKRRELDSRSLIQDFRVVTRTDKDRVDLIEIEIPEWVYSAVASRQKTLPLLTMSQDYFLISSGLGRFIYRLARKAAGRTNARYSVSELYKRSGSTQEFRFFHRDLREFVTRTQAFPMPDYDLQLIDGQEGPVLQMTRRNKLALEEGEQGTLAIPEA